MINRKAFLTNAIEEGFKNNVSGYPLVLKHSKGRKLIDYKIYGNSVQKGANLFDGTYKNGYIASNKVAGFSETVGNHYLVVMPCEPNTTYILEKEYATERFTVGFTDEYPYTGCPIIGTLTNNSAKKITATSGENSQYLVAFVYNKTIDTLPLPNVEIYKEQSPDNPIEIQSVGDLVTDTADSNYGKYKIPVKVSGKNMFNRNAIFSSVLSGGYLEVTDTGYNILKTNSFSNGMSIGNFKDLVPNLKVGDKFKIAFETNAIRNNQNVNYIYLNVYKSILRIGNKYTCTQDMLNSAMYIYSGGTEDCYYKNIMVYKSTETSDFEPYQDPVTTNIYLNEPLRKVGEYADYIDFKTQQVVRNIYKYDLTGNETGWIDRNLNYDSYGIVFRNGSLLEKPANFQYKNAFCNYFKYGAIASAKGIFSLANSPIDWQFNISDGQLGISKDEEKSVRLQKWLEWLQTNYSNGNPVSMYYVLEEEIPENIELPNIPTLKYANTITTDTTVEASNMNVSYKSFEKGE